MNVITILHYRNKTWVYCFQQTFRVFSLTMISTATIKSRFNILPVLYPKQQDLRGRIRQTTHGMTPHTQRLLAAQYK